MRQRAVNCALMRGGTSKGLYFLASDLPGDEKARDKVLLAAMGSPDIRQIDGVGGAHPLTSKVAIVSPSQRPDADVEYLFLQVVVDEPRVDTSQTCGNILAGVGPFAIERGLVPPASGGSTPVRIHMVNSDSIVVATIETPDGSVRYDGDARIDGVPGTAAPVPIEFMDIAGSMCGALLPTGNVRDRITGLDVTCIDNGMPVVVVSAASLGIAGDESPKELEANTALRERVEALRLAAGPLMNLGDVRSKTVPKMSIVSPPRNGGAISTRTFIPHRAHEAIGVFGAVSVAAACVLPGSVAAESAALPGGSALRLDIEHPTGSFTVDVEVGEDQGKPVLKRSALLRTARMLMSGQVYVPASAWEA